MYPSLDLSLKTHSPILTSLHLFPIAELYNCQLAAPSPLPPLVSSPAAAAVVLGSSKSLVFTFGKADDNVCFAGT